MPPKKQPQKKLTPKKSTKNEEHVTPPKPESIYTCEECQRIYDQESRKAFCHARCHVCRMPVYFNKLVDAHAYIQNAPYMNEPPNV